MPTKKMTPQKVAAIARKAVRVNTPSKLGVFTPDYVNGLGGTMTDLTNIVEGSDNNHRIGRTIKTFGIQMKLHAKAGGASRSRIIVVRGRKNLTSSMFPVTLNGVCDADIMDVLFDRQIDFKSGDNWIPAVNKLFKNLPTKQRYDTALGASCVENGYYLYTLSDDASAIPWSGIAGYIKVFWRDVATQKAK